MGHHLVLRELLFGVWWATDRPSDRSTTRTVLTKVPQATTRASWAASSPPTSSRMVFGFRQVHLRSRTHEEGSTLTYDLPKIHDADIVSTIVSIYDVGCMVGCLIAALFGSALGRRRTIWVGMVLVTIGEANTSLYTRPSRMANDLYIGAAIQASSFSSAQMIAGRVITV